MSSVATRSLSKSEVSRLLSEECLALIAADLDEAGVPRSADDGRELNLYQRWRIFYLGHGGE